VELGEGLAVGVELSVGEGLGVGEGICSTVAVADGAPRVAVAVSVGKTGISTVVAGVGWVVAVAVAGSVGL
jgi:hypothetical protein